MGCIAYNCNALPDHTLEVCGDTMPGGGWEALVFTCDATAVENDDFGTEATVNNDISAGKASLFKNLKIGVPAGSATDASASYVAGQEPKTITNQYAGTWMDENVNASNDSAYADLNATSGFVAGAILLRLVDDPTTGILIDPSNGIMFKGGMVVPDDNTDSVHYEYSINWRHPSGPKTQTLPANIFT